MIMVTAIIQPFRLERVREALQAAGIPGLTVCPCAGHGRDPRMVPSFHDGPQVAEIVSGIRIETAVARSMLRTAVAAIVQGARIDGSGAGKIFVSPLERVVSIRTGADERDSQQALQDAAE